MDDSSEDLFGIDDNFQAVDDLEGLHPSDPPPDYVQSDEFKHFVTSNDVYVNSKFGYIYIHLCKPYYFPGEIVRGSIILDVFNQLPKNYKQISIRFLGREVVGRHFSKIAKVLKASAAANKDSISRRSEAS